VTPGGADRLGVVLDQAGMVSFARGDSRVAELIVETAAQHLAVGVPTVALLAAHTAVRGDEAARARLGLLTALPAVRVLPLTEVEAAGVANLPATGEHDGDLGRAHAAWAAETYRAYYATTDAPSAPERLPPGQIVDLGKENPCG
jgi:hypothetical protein